MLYTSCHTWELSHCIASLPIISSQHNCCQTHIPFPSTLLLPHKHSFPLHNTAPMLHLKTTTTHVSSRVSPPTNQPTCWLTDRLTDIPPLQLPAWALRVHLNATSRSAACWPSRALCDTRHTRLLNTSYGSTDPPTWIMTQREAASPSRSVLAAKFLPQRL